MAGTETMRCGNDGLRPGGLHPSYEDKPKRRMGAAQRNPSIHKPAQTTALRTSPPAWPAPKRWIAATMGYGQAAFTHPTAGSVYVKHICSIPWQHRKQAGNDGLRPDGLHPSYEDKPKRRMGAAQRNPSIPKPARTTGLRTSPPAWPAPKRWVTATMGYGRTASTHPTKTNPNVGWVQRSETHQSQTRPRYAPRRQRGRHRNDALRQ
jgi:hypothetical protein